MKVKQGDTVNITYIIMTILYILFKSKSWLMMYDSWCFILEVPSRKF